MWYVICILFLNKLKILTIYIADTDSTSKYKTIKYPVGFCAEC